MGGVWTRADWNDIIDQVNDLAENPDDGCEALAPLDEVEEDHIWTDTDVQQVRDLLTSICDENEFSADTTLWKQDIIDEINEAIGKGWCNCCDADQQEPIDIPILNANGISAIGGNGCGGDPCPGYVSMCAPQNQTSVAALVNGQTFAPSGYKERTWYIAGYYIVDPEYTGVHPDPCAMPYGWPGGKVDCDGSINDATEEQTIQSNYPALINECYCMGGENHWYGEQPTFWWGVVWTLHISAPGTQFDCCDPEDEE